MKRTTAVSRVLPVLFAAILAVSVFAAAPLPAEASAGNPYPQTYTDDKGIYHPGNCTWQVWEEAYTRLGIRLPGWRNAGGWCNRAKADGYQVVYWYNGYVPPANSIAEWSGHVGWVIAADASGAIIREGNIKMNGSYQAVWQQWWSWDDLRRYRGNPVGFIILNGNPNPGPAPLADFTSVEDAAEVTETSAKLTAHIPYQSISECGVYIGTDANALSKAAGDGAGRVQNMWYTVTGLKPGTTYYYQFYYTANGQTKWSAKKSFRTGGSSVTITAGQGYQSYSSESNQTISITAEYNSNVAGTWTNPRFAWHRVGHPEEYREEAAEITSGGSGSHVEMTFDFEKAHIALQPGTDYQFVFKVTFNGQPYNSGISYFKNDDYPAGYTDRGNQQGQKDNPSDNKGSDTSQNTGGDTGNNEPDTGNQPAFRDVTDRGAYYYDAVNWAYKNKIASGTSGDTFSPMLGCTRGQMVTFLYRLAGSPSVSGRMPFTDVSRSDYYYKPLQWAYQEEIASGTAADRFSPDAVCTRGQMAVFLYRMAGEPYVSGSCPFYDVDDDAYYADAVTWAKKHGVANGTSAGTYSPDAECTRGQMAVFLYNYSRNVK